MKVFFGCTTAQFETYRNYYFSIRNSLVESGCKILFDWLEDADSKIKRDKGGKRNIKYVYKQVVEAISDADAVIIEHTIPNFSSSHQINFALMKRKPTLVLRLHNDNANFSDSYIDAIESPYLSVRSYTLENYKPIINEFLGISRISSKPGRYNVVLNQQEKYYLDWASGKYNLSRSAIIRSSISDRIKSDKDFAKHLENLSIIVN